MNRLRALVVGLGSRGRSAVHMAWMALRNSTGRRPVLDPSGPVVSLTTFGRRTRLVHLAMESIARGRVRPSRLILWLDDETVVANPTPGLRRLIARGAEVRRCEDLGPHKKYFPFVLSEPLETALVTADDDVIYPRSWLADLVAVHRQEPEAVVAHVTRTMAFDPSGALAPYRTWKHSRPGVRSARTFAIGIGGVLYPTGALRALAVAGDAFRDSAPRADDVWLHRTAVLRTGRMVVRPETLSVHDLVPVYGGGDGGLMRTNVSGGGNDVQIAASYDDADLSVLRASVAGGDE